MEDSDGTKMIDLGYAGRFIMSSITYPVENAKTLIQLGHEPLQPFKTKTLFGSPALGLPNIFKYTKHIYDVDGLQGCYRGFFPWVSTNLLYTYSQNKIEKLFPKILNEEKNEDDLSEEEQLSLFCGVLVRGVSSRAIAVIVSQPLHVVTLRTIAQFVGHETKYSGIFSSLLAIVREEGISGLFSGLVPRLLYDIFLYTMTATGFFLFHQFVVRDNEFKKYSKTIIHYLAGTSLYPLIVVGNCMSVTNCGLAAGSPPRMPHYHNMFDCWTHLQNIKQLKRGSNVIWRYYTPVSNTLLTKKS